LGSALEELLQRPEPMAHVAAHTARKRPMHHPRKLLPFELADLREAGACRARLEPILDIEDRDRILLAKDQPTRWLDIQLFERQLDRRAQRNRLVDDRPPTLSGFLDRLDFAAPARVVEGIGD
jgi:hypothetical protein